MKWKRGPSRHEIIRTKSAYPSCEDCPLYATNPRVQPLIVRDSNYLLIGDSPGSRDFKRPFEGDSGDVLHGILRDAGIDPYQCSIGSLVNCRPIHTEGDKEGNGRPPTDCEQAACASQLQALIDKVRPGMLIVFGKETLRHFIPHMRKSIAKLRGNVYEWNGIPVVPILHPRVLLSSGSHTDRQLIVADLARARGRLYGGLVEKADRVSITKITKRGEMEDLIAHVGDVPHISNDIESRTLDPYGHVYYEPGILSAAVATSETDAYWFPLMHRENKVMRPIVSESTPGYPRNNDEERYWHDAYLRLMRRARRIVYHNAKFDEMYITAILRSLGLLGSSERIVTPDRVACTMILQYLVHNSAGGDTDEASGTYALKMLAQARGYPDWDSAMKHKYLGHLQKTDPKWTYELIPLQPLGTYNAWDVVPTIELYNELIAEMLSSPLGRYRLQLWRSLVQGELSTFLHCTTNGVSVDLSAWRSTVTRYSKEREQRLVEFAALPPVFNWLIQNKHIAGMQTSIRDLVTFDAMYAAHGQDPVPVKERRKDVLNISSPDQMVDLLINHCDLPIIEKTDSGAPSLDGASLQRYEMHYWDLIAQCGELKSKDAEHVAEHRLTKFAALEESQGALYQKAEDRLVEILRDPATTNTERESAKTQLKCAAGRGLMLCRQVEKMISHYVAPIPSKVSINDGYFHPGYKLHGTVTGRLSSWFHTIPMDENIKKIFRSKFRTDAKNPYYRTKHRNGYLIGADYSGIEVRLTAIFADDGRNVSTMLKTLQEGGDLHRIVAATMLNKDPEDVSKAERQFCKGPHFAHLYLGSAETIAKTLWKPGTIGESGKPVDLKQFTKEVEGQLERYDLGFPHVPRFWERVQHALATHGISAPLSYLQRELEQLAARPERDRFLVTPFGRVINLEREMSFWDEKVRPVNWPTQSTAADLTTSAAVRVDEALRAGGFKSHLTGTIHDALYIDTHPEEWKEVVTLVYDTMEDRSLFPWFNCPLIAEVEIGDTLSMSEVSRDHVIAPKVPNPYRRDRHGNVIGL